MNATINYLHTFRYTPTRRSARNRSTPSKVLSPISTLKQPSFDDFRPAKSGDESHNQVVRNKSIQRNASPPISNPQTSPIQDTTDLSMLPPPLPNKKGIVAGPSRLFMEVEERVARHSSSRKRDTVLSISGKGRLGKSTKNSKDTLSSEDSVIDVSSSDCRSSSPESVLEQGKNTVKPLKLKPTISQIIKVKTKGKKEKPHQMTPEEYAKYIIEKAANSTSKRKSSTVKFLEGFNIFYTGGDMKYASERTRGRMDIVRLFSVKEFDVGLIRHRSP